jgi:hypothetical protein
MQNVELHFSQAPVYDFEAIKRRAEAILGDPLMLLFWLMPNPHACSPTEVIRFNIVKAQFHHKLRSSL